MGNRGPELVSDPRFADDAGRSVHEAELRAAIEAWAANSTAHEAVAHLEAAGVPAAPIWNTEQALASDQAVARGLLREVDDDRLPGLRLPSQPVRLTGSAPNVVGPAPGLGEHTDEILGRLLGATTSRLAELHALGAFGTPSAPGPS